MKMTTASRTLVGVVLTLTALLSFAVPAYAGNSADTGWTFSLSPYHGIGRTGQRQKQDYTPSYVKLNSKSDGGTIWAWIERTYQDPDVHSQVRIIGVGQDAKISHDAFDMYNKVQVSACIQNSVTHSGYVAVSGLWSPDSVCRFGIEPYRVQAHNG